MNESEKLLERIFVKHNISFHRIETGEDKTPDYLARLNAEDTYWEVKELAPNDSERGVLKSVNENGEALGYSVDSKRVENSIKHACKQLKDFGAHKYPCFIVLYDSRPFEIKDFLFQQQILTVMLGTAEFMKVNGEYKEVKRQGGLFTNLRRTYVSAIVVLYKVSEKAVFLHNPHAKKCMLRDIIDNQFVDNYAFFDKKWQKLESSDNKF